VSPGEGRGGSGAASLPAGQEEVVKLEERSLNYNGF
jgi:hypothetical protein